MKCTEAMAKRAQQAPPPTLSSRSKSPPMSGEGRASNSMAWVRIFKKSGGLKKSYQPGSMLSLALTKGLLNEPGQNSCFLNSAVQVLWQLDIFRRSLRQLSGHFCLGDSCIFCPLKSIFSQFQQSRERALPSDCLRNALAETFKDEQRFQLGLMDDAAECFENILERIHLHIVSDTATDACLSKSCITHQKFAMTLYEQFICRSCGASSDPHPFTELVHYISTTALCQQVDRIMAKNERLRSDMFGELLQAANTIGDPRRCPSNCGQSIKIRRVLMNCPEIVTIGFVWDAEQSDLTDDVIRSLGPCLHLSGLFNRVTDENAKRNELHLVGMICFASKHYSAFAYHTKSSKWMFFDDATVKEIGSKWKDVASKCIRGHFQPLLLFYTNPEGDPISCEDAPRQTTLCSRYKAQLNSEVTVTGSKKLDAVKEHAGPHQAHIHPLPSSWTSGIGREKLPLGSPNTFSEPLICNAQRSCESSKKVRGQRRAEQYKQKENGMRPFADQTVKRSSRTERPSSHSNRSCQEPREPWSSGVQDSGHSHRNSASPAHRNQDGCQEEWEKSGSGGSRSRSTWRPVREVLNVDSVLNELEQRRQQHRDKAHCNKPSSQERALNAEGDLTLDREVNRNREDRKLKCLMTIYEDEQRHETESHSSLDSESRSNQQRGDRPTGGPRTLLRSDTWTIQRTESGYESSDRLSSGSTNPDSPGIDALAIKDHTFIPESHLISQPHQNGGDTSQSVLRSPSHNSKHQPKTQGKNSDAVSHSHLKSSPNSRRKSKHNTSSSRRGAPCNHDSRCGQSEHQEPGSGRGHGRECPGQRGVAKTSSSEWNNPDKLALFEAEERDSAYSNSEAAASDYQSSPTSHPYRTHGTSAVPPQPRPDYCVHSQAGEASPGVFRPWQLQEPFPPSPRPSSRSAGCYASLPHRKAHVLARPSLDAGSRWDPEKSTSCESKDRLPGCRPAALVLEQEVALTRYFNVDSCMTETYRLRYHHQRPLVLSATVPHAEHGGTGHFLTMDTHSDMPYNRPDTSHNSNKTTVTWNKVTTKGLDEHGFL